MEFLTILAIALLVGSVIANVAINLVASELYDWAPRLANWLIDQTVAKLREPGHRSDYREQFRADLADVPGHLSKVWFAFRTYLGRYRLVYDIEGEQVREVDLDVLRPAGRWFVAASLLMQVGDTIERLWPHHSVVLYLNILFILSTTMTMVYVFLLCYDLYKPAKDN